MIVDFLRDFIDTRAATKGKISAAIDASANDIKKRPRAWSLWNRGGREEVSKDGLPGAGIGSSGSNCNVFVSLEDAIAASATHREYRKNMMQLLNGPVVVGTEEAHCILTPYENHAAMFHVLELIVDRMRMPCPAAVVGTSSNNDSVSRNLQPGTQVNARLCN